MSAPGWSRRLFGKIARPRLAGSASLAEAQSVIAKHLTQLGFQVDLRPFVTSQRKLLAITVGAAGLGWVALMTAPLMLLSASGWPVTLTGLAALAATGMLAAGIASGGLPLDTPAISGVNIVARRGVARCWLVAHADSKSQAFSLAGRVVAGLVVVLGLAMLVALLLLRLAGPLAPGLVIGACLPAVMGGAVLTFSRAGDRSAGAVDNASGVIAALTAAHELRHREDVAVLITDAEELGLEGASAWVAMKREGRWFVNFDGLDDRGPYRVMRHATSAERPKARRASRELAGRLADALRSAGARAVVGALPPGVLVDGVVLAKHGMIGITVSRGDVTTLRVVHTPRDTADRLTLRSAMTAGSAAANAVEEFLGRS